MPAVGDLFTDVRGGDRRMRVSYHGDRGVVVVSLWAGEVCRGSFRMAAEDVRGLISLLTEIDAPRPDDTGPDSPAGAVAGTAEWPEPAVEETGDIGTARRSLLPPVPAYKVA